MKHLITANDIRTDGRFVSAKLDDKRIDPYIDESEQLDIKPRIGDALLLDLIDYVNADDKASYPDYSLLISGGVYESKSCHGESTKKSFKGLSEALNYYTWARIVKNNNFTVTRQGFVEKTDTYSQNTELKQRLVIEKDALSIADKYLLECVEYLKANRDKFPLFKKGGQRNRLRISIIGD